MILFIGKLYLFDFAKWKYIAVMIISLFYNSIDFIV